MLMRTEHGLKWNDLELSCMCEDNLGRVYFRIKRGNKSYQLYVTKGGKAVLHREETQ
jgi:hypothetical protein